MANGCKAAEIPDSQREIEELVQCLHVKTREVLVGVSWGSLWSLLEKLRTPTGHKRARYILGALSSVAFHSHWILTTWQIPHLQTLAENLVWVSPSLDSPAA